MNLNALLYGMVLMLPGAPDLIIPDNCYHLDFTIESLAYGKFVTLHYDKGAYDEFTNILEGTYRILDCDSKILEDRNKRTLRHTVSIGTLDHYYFMRDHYQYCPEINSYLEEHQSVDSAKLSNIEQKTLSNIKKMHNDLQCDQGCYMPLDYMFSHKK